MKRDESMLGFLIAIAAGAATPKIEDLAARPLAQLMGKNVEVFDDELPVLAFIIGMLIAAVLSAIVSNGSALALVIGGTLGFFGLRIVRFIQRMVEGSDEEA